MNRRESPTSTDAELARVLAYLQAHAHDGRMMARDDYDCMRPADMMSSQRLLRRGYSMTRLAELAGLTPHPAGRRAKWAGSEEEPEAEATQSRRRRNHGRSLARRRAAKWSSSHATGSRHVWAI
jgi:hypothetical protein